MKALILAGGLGTRLRSLVSDRPKPMAEIDGKPFLGYQIEQLRAQGFHDLVLCVGHRAEQVEAYFGGGHCWDVKIAYSVETELLGTAGAIKTAEDLIEGKFLVLNGDSYLDVDLRSLVASHRVHRTHDPHALATIAALAVEDAGAYGTLELDSDGHIRRFREKDATGPGCINAGVYVLEPGLLDLIPTGRRVSIEKETFPLVLDRGYHLFGHPVEGFFVDIGTPEGYRRFQSYVEELSR